MPWRYNAHSPLLEVCICMPLYACVPLFLENTPPLLERWYYTWPKFRPFMVQYLNPVIRATYPYVVAAAYALPMLHQSSLGALMLLGLAVSELAARGERHLLRWRHAEG